MAVVGLAAGPLDGALAVGWVTAGPDTNADAHGGLRVASAALSISVLQGTDGVAVNVPGGGILLPGDLVGVPSVLGVGDTGPGVAVVAGSVTLAEVVGLNGRRVAAQSLLL